MLSHPTDETVKLRKQADDQTGSMVDALLDGTNYSNLDTETERLLPSKNLSPSDTGLKLNQSAAVKETTDADESPVVSNTSSDEFSRCLEEAIHGDMDGAEAMNHYSSSGSDTGSSNSEYLDLCEVVDINSDSRQDFLAPELDPIRQGLVDRVMEEFWIILNHNWDVGAKECAGGTPCTSNESNSSIASLNATSLASSQRKRQRNDEEERDDNNRRDSRKSRRSVDQSSDPESVRRLACPFRKHDARRYSARTHRVCALSHWETIARVKYVAPFPKLQ